MELGYLLIIAVCMIGQYYSYWKGYSRGMKRGIEDTVALVALADSIIDED